jgi:ligand-binding sensor domain-containing protein
MYQDKSGYLWAGGFGGLTRFDGKTFVNFGPKNGLIDHNVTAIAQNRLGKIFIGTSKGLSVMHQNKFTNYGKSSGLKNISITAFCQGLDEKMFIGTESGLYIFDNGSISAVDKLADYKISCIYPTEDANYYIGTDKGVIVFSSKGVMIIDKAKGLPSDQINCITKFRSKIYIGTDRGLGVFDLSTHKLGSYYVADGLISDNISSLLNRNNAFLWIGSHSGLVRFDNKKFESYNVGHDNNSNVVRCLLHDREDNIWLGTHSGLFRHRDRSFSTFDKIDGPGRAFIFQIFRDRDENLWMCSENMGVYKYADNKFTRFDASNGLGSNVCKTGLQDREGRLIFATDKGLLHYKNDKFVQIPLPREFLGSYEMLYETKNHVVWLAGGNGVASLIWKNNVPVVKYFALPITTKYLGVYGLCEDDQNNLWIGTYHGGLFKMRDDSIIHVSKKLGMAEEDFFALKFHNNHLFSASLNGLLVFNTKTEAVDYITAQDGLNSELVYSIEFAENHKVLWIGTNQGINKLDLTKYYDSNKVEIVSFSKQQGFMGVECNSNGIWEDKDGSLWFGTVSGLVKHEPQNLKRNQAKNITNIQNIKLFSEDTLLANNSELPSNFNTITFYYRGICLTNPAKVLYVKKLEGLENEWSAESAEDYSKYANLSPGKYTLKVKSRNNEGAWDDVATTFTFTIRAPFYTRWWFLLGSSLGLVGLTFTGIRWRIATIEKKQRLEFERKVEMSKVELKALRSQMNPHFIFNSLNSIQHFIFNNKSNDAIKYLNKFARLVRLILSNSDKPTVTVGEDIEALKLYLELEQMRFEDKFESEVIIDPSVDIDYDIMPPLLMQPYVENAILHGLNPKQGKGKLTIFLSSLNNYLICTITDNGIGRKKSAEIKRTMPVNKHKSLGMKITEDRLKLLNELNNSRLSVAVTDLTDEGGNAVGTRVEIFVPINV